MLQHLSSLVFLQSSFSILSFHFDIQQILFAVVSEHFPSSPSAWVSRGPTQPAGRRSAPASALVSGHSAFFVHASALDQRPEGTLAPNSWHGRAEMLFATGNPRLYTDAEETSLSITQSCLTLPSTCLPTSAWQLWRVWTHRYTCRPLCAYVFAQKILNIQRFNNVCRINN